MKRVLVNLSRRSTGVVVPIGIPFSWRKPSKITAKGYNIVIIIVNMINRFGYQKNVTDKKENIRLTKNHQTHLGERERDEVENLDFRAAKT